MTEEQLEQEQTTQQKLKDFKSSIDLKKEAEETHTEEPRAEASSIDKAFERREQRVEETVKEAEEIQLTRLEQKEKDLKKLEDSIDRKKRELTKLVSEAHHQGRSLAGDRVQESEEDKGKRAANDFLKTTGLKAYPEVE